MFDFPHGQTGRPQPNRLHPVAECHFQPEHYAGLQPGRFAVLHFRCARELGPDDFTGVTAALTPRFHCPVSGFAGRLNRQLQSAPSRRQGSASATLTFSSHQHSADRYFECDDDGPRWRHYPYHDRGSDLTQRPAPTSPQPHALGLSGTTRQFRQPTISTSVSMFCSARVTLRSGPAHRRYCGVFQLHPNPCTWRGKLLAHIYCSNTPHQDYRM